MLQELWEFLLRIFHAIHTFLLFCSYTKIDRGNDFNNSILVMGDDIAHGSGDKVLLGQSQGFCKHLKNRLESRDQIRQTWRIYHLGMPKSTSLDWLPTSHKKVSSMERVWIVNPFNPNYQYCF